jgi:uncharacterized protein YgbK (DUF1537 family)
VIDTESRALDGLRAAERVRAAAAGAPAKRVFKKIDSTLRGRIGAETEAVMTAVRLSTALVCPAFPAQGRVVVDHVLTVGGTPVSATAVGRDPEFPAIPAPTRLGFPDVEELLRPQFERPLTWLPLEIVRSGAQRLREGLARLTGTIILAEAETDGDLDGLVAAALSGEPGPLLVGSAGLARPLARQMGRLAERVLLPRARHWLIVAGSRHPVTRRQVAFARAAGMTVVATPDEDQPGAVQRAAAEARRIIHDANIDLVAIAGGQTAVAVFEALRTERVDLVGAPGAGLALGYVCASGRPRLAVLTKAGGFGSDGLFVTLAEEARGKESTR